MADRGEVEFRWFERIPMRDGVRLNATLYLPENRDSPVPGIVTLTPYISDSHHERGMYFAAHGFTFAIVDVRGRGNSEGTFRPFIQEAQDGYDVVEWLARQSYCNRKVAMWGSSYLGYVQWATAKEFPPHLTTIVPTASPNMGTDFPMRNNIFYPVLLQWLTLTSGRALQAQIVGDSGFWSALYRRWHESGRPFRDLDATLGNPSPIFQDWLRHPEPDVYWDAHNPTAAEYARLNIPILTITGSYDDDQPGALAHYRQHLGNASDIDRARHYLVIGPWDHRGTGVPRAAFGGLTLSPASLIDMPKLHREWYAWTMQQGPQPEFLMKRVAYYVMGAEMWRYADTLEEATARYETYFLDSANNADDAFSAGSLALAPGQGRSDTYLYDPGDLQGPEVDVESRADGGSLVDQGLLSAMRGRQFVYCTAPFERDTEVTGFFTLRAWIAINCADTDFYVSVSEIWPDGSCLRLSTDALRARYREGLRTPKLIRTRAPLRYDFERFTFVSREIKRGHRLRLVIAPVGRLIEGIFVQKNYNGGGVVADESANDGRPVTVTLIHDETHPSALDVPIGQTRGSDEPTEPPLTARA
jgi:putative CocE/NonD family hydrolase